MPFYLRPRRSWFTAGDWRVPAEIRHLPRCEIRRLLAEARCRAGMRGFRLGLILLQMLWVPVMVSFILDGYFPEGGSFERLGMCLLAVLPLLVFGGWGAYRFRRRFRAALRELLLTEHIRPAVCFECRYFTEGFEGSECPVCGIVLYRSRSAPPL
jgi:uncharacterized paraquat-inducible protein A